MNESSTSIVVFAVSALGALGFFVSFGGEVVPMGQVFSALVFPGLMLLLLVAAFGLIRILLALSK